MTVSSRGARLAGVLALVALVAVSNADVLISNMPSNDGSQTAAISDLRMKAMGFTTPGGTAYTLTTAVLRLNSATSDIQPIVELRSDNAGNPGTVLMTFANPSFGTGLGTYSFTGNINLDPSTSYWLQVSGPAGVPTFDWKASSPSETPTGTFTHFGSLFTTNGGTSWSNSSILVSYELQGQPVPEPASLAALGLGALALIRRRRRKA